MSDPGLPRGAHVFIDETKARDFILVGVWVAAAEVGRARAAIRRLVPPGSRRVHFAKLSGRQRDAVLTAISGCRLHAVEVRTSARDQADARIRTLGRMLGIAAGSDPSRIVIEQDHSFVGLDLRVAAAAGLSVDHLRAPEDPMLWVADAVAWCIQRGEGWPEKVGDFVVRRDLV